MDRRKWKSPLWYYGLIALTALSTGAGAYFRGKIVQGEIETARITMGLIVTALCGLAVWAFRSLLKEIRNMGARVGVMADAIFVLLLRESKNRPEDEELEKLLRNMIRERDLNRYRNYGDD